jgi:hypothetical protein
MTMSPSQFGARTTIRGEDISELPGSERTFNVLSTSNSELPTSEF